MNVEKEKENKPFRIFIRKFGRGFAYNEVRQIDNSYGGLGPSSNWMVSRVDFSKRLCSLFDGRKFPFHEFMFSKMHFGLPFNEFEIEIITYLNIFLSQLYLVSWAYVKVF